MSWAIGFISNHWIYINGRSRFNRRVVSTPGGQTENGQYDWILTVELEGELTVRIESTGVGDGLMSEVRWNLNHQIYKHERSRFDRGSQIGGGEGIALNTLRDTI